MKRTAPVPVGQLRPFDHGAQAMTWRYQQLAAAIDTFAAQGSPLGWSSWLRLLTDIARAAPYRDRCPGCPQGRRGSSAVPYRADVTGTVVEAYYVCAKCESSWTCTWALNSPLLY